MLIGTQQRRKRSSYGKKDPSQKKEEQHTGCRVNHSTIAITFPSFPYGSGTAVVESDSAV